MNYSAPYPILYSFRRCPYAMRARLALGYAKTQYWHREVVLKHKPKELLTISAKGTVPVLVLPDTVIDESLDIMHWALHQCDPDGWLKAPLNQQLALIQQNDSELKPLLDRYKYAIDYPEKSDNEHQNNAFNVMNQLLVNLQNSFFLFGAIPSLADFAIFPFVRQLASVDKDWFQQNASSAIIQWMNYFTDLDLFKQIMIKQPEWRIAKKDIWV
ncbi:MAG: glutathione S-transferase [Gammaproteobacteria bacterium CG22_combo_CG10-13_8_21_14_all_40_8]|nr:MAG: glutathione S-transferase [Gammaproteobacteria bacterium CG22_combo_CG10-13_8_21_14_all_40_8]